MELILHTTKKGIAPIRLDVVESITAVGSLVLVTTKTGEQETGYKITLQ